MKTVGRIIKELQNTNKTNDKIAILKANSHNELLCKVLYYTYNTHLKYGITESVFDNYNTGGNVRSGDVFAMLNELANSNINDQLRKDVVAYVNNYDEELQWLIKGMLVKDLRINMGIKNINKGIKGLIKEWNVQQAYPIDKVKLKNGEWFALMLKLNGTRATLFKGDFRSRQDKLMTGFNHIIKDFETLGINLFDYVIDGELVRKNIDGVSDNENFRIGTGIINSHSETKEEIEFVVFDIVPTDEFINGESSLTFKKRLDLLNKLKYNIEVANISNVSVAPCYYVGNDLNEKDKWLEYTESKGLEGLMLLRDMPYKTKRHNGILKVKAFKSSDVRIIGFEEGNGKHICKLGAFVVDYKGFKVNVGSGYTDEQREEFWNNRHNLIGRILEVKYKEESKDKNGNISLQFPTFICIRELGKEVSYE